MHINSFLSGYVAFYSLMRVLILKENWLLTQEAFDKLLARLGSDRELAGARYELLRANLIGYFRRQGMTSTSELADETIDRVARKIAQGEEIPDASLPGYFHSVARNVWREHLRGNNRVTDDLEALPYGSHPATDPASKEAQLQDDLQAEQRFDCLEACMQKLSAEDHKLLADYYLMEGEHIEGRKRLAEQMGTTLPSLRVRVMRLKEKLQRCVTDCLSGSRRL